MLHRIVITGAESTGKTTLAQTLANHYSEPWTEEFVRKYVDQIDRELQPKDLEPIANGQLAIEDAMLEKAEKLIVHDTNILSSIIYAKHYFDTEFNWVNRRFKERDYSLYLFCTPDIPWKSDPGQRESPLARTQLHQIFKTRLKSLKLPYLEIQGTNKQRFERAVTAIDKLIEH